MSLKKISSALISVYHKDNLESIVLEFLASSENIYINGDQDMIGQILLNIFGLLKCIGQKKVIKNLYLKVGFLSRLVQFYLIQLPVLQMHVVFELLLLAVRKLQMKLT